MTWTLPDQFPPEKYRRVTLDGGALTQEDEPLSWDPHGYYEFALDVGSVPLSAERPRASADGTPLAPPTTRGGRRLGAPKRAEKPAFRARSGAPSVSC